MLPIVYMHSLYRSLASSLLVLVPIGTVPAAKPEKDHHSLANPEHIRVRHVDLDLTDEDRVAGGVLSGRDAHSLRGE